MKPLWLQHGIVYLTIVGTWILLCSLIQGTLSTNEIESLNAHYGEVDVTLDFQHLKKLNEQQRETLLQFFSQSAEWRVAEYYKYGKRTSPLVYKITKRTRVDDEWIEDIDVIHVPGPNKPRLDVTIYLGADLSQIVFPAIGHNQVLKRPVEIQEIQLAIYQQSYGSDERPQSKFRLLGDQIIIEIDEKSPSMQRERTIHAVKELSYQTKKVLEEGLQSALLVPGSLIQGEVSCIIGTNESDSYRTIAKGYVNTGESGFVTVEKSGSVTGKEEARNPADIEYVGWSSNAKEQFYFFIMNQGDLLYKHERYRYDLFFYPEGDSEKRYFLKACTVSQ